MEHMRLVTLAWRGKLNRHWAYLGIKNHQPSTLQLVEFWIRSGAGIAQWGNAQGSEWLPQGYHVETKMNDTYSNNTPTLPNVWFLEPDNFIFYAHSRLSQLHTRHEMAKRCQALGSLEILSQSFKKNQQRVARYRTLYIIHENYV